MKSISLNDSLKCPKQKDCKILESNDSYVKKNWHFNTKILCVIMIRIIIRLRLLKLFTEKKSKKDFLSKKKNKKNN